MIRASSPLTVILLCPVATGLSVVAYLWRVNVSVCLRRAGMAGRVGWGGAGRRGDGRAEWAGLAVGVIGMSGSKIWDEAGPRGLRGPGDLRLHSENKHRRHLQAAVWGRGGRGCCWGQGGGGVELDGGVGWWWRERGGEGWGVDLQSEHNQPSVFIRLVVCESRNKCV